MTGPPLLGGPYLGLRPFRKNEWPIFFGREAIIDDVLDRLAATRLVVVHGSSGCGKSSLILAGVLPRLEQEHSRHTVPWRTAALRPGSSPMWNLATAIARLVEKLGEDDEPTLATIRTVRRLLNSGRDALGRIQQRFELGKDGNVCILLDQFEELFRYAREIGREEAEALVEVLRGFERGQDGPGPPGGVYAILTMRSDHLGDCGHFEGLAELVNATQYLLPRIGDEDLLRAIRQPARLFGGEVSADLAIRLIEESRAEIDALPLIQHALMRMWRQAGGQESAASRRRNRPDPGSAPSPILTVDAYDGLQELLSKHAEEVLREVTAGHRTNAKVTEYLFRAITEIDAEGRGIRRPQRLSRLVGATGGDETALQVVIDRFSRPDCGFLVRSHGDDPIIDIGHEALIRCWRKLDDPTIDRASGRPKGWVQREQSDQRTWRSLLFQAETGDRISPALLKDREAWFESLPGPGWAERHDGGWEKVVRLLASSRNQVMRSRLGTAAAVGIGILLGGFGFAYLGFALQFEIQRQWTRQTAFRPHVMSPAELAALDDLADFRECAEDIACPAMIVVPGGTFTMGSPESEAGSYDDERPQHEVTIARFAIGRTEVTHDEWRACVAGTDQAALLARLDDPAAPVVGCAPISDGGFGAGDRPVIYVSWHDARGYIAWLNDMIAGDPDAGLYRLPTEAEWEYAARAGSTTRYHFGDDPADLGKYAWFAENSDGRTQPVGKQWQNAFGLHDMHGNVWEWVEDCGHENYKSAPNDGAAWMETEGGDCSVAVLRGGSWDGDAEGLRSAGRSGARRGNRDDDFGFRVVRTLGE